MVISNELKPGNYFMYDGNLYVVLDTLHNKTAMRFLQWGVDEEKCVNMILTRRI